MPTPMSSFQTVVLWTRGDFWRFGALAATFLAEAALGCCTASRACVLEGASRRNGHPVGMGRSHVARYMCQPALRLKYQLVMTEGKSASTAQPSSAPVRSESSALPASTARGCAARSRHLQDLRSLAGSSFEFLISSTSQSCGSGALSRKTFRRTRAFVTCDRAYVSWALECLVPRA